MNECWITNEMRQRWDQIGLSCLLDAHADLIEDLWRGAKAHSNYEKAARLESVPNDLREAARRLRNAQEVLDSLGDPRHHE